MTQSRPPEDDALDMALQELAEVPPSVPDGLMTKVIADAMVEMPKPVRNPWWRQVFGALGGWPAIAGLAATACVGIWVGGVMSDDLFVTFGFSESASLDFGEDFGAFDLLLLDG